MRSKSAIQVLNHLVKNFIENDKYYHCFLHTPRGQRDLSVNLPAYRNGNLPEPQMRMLAGYAFKGSVVVVTLLESNWDGSTKSQREIPLREC